MERARLQDGLRDCHFLAAMSDGSTDKSISEQEIVYVRAACNGQPREYFVSLETVEKAAAARMLWRGASREQGKLIGRHD